MERINGIEGKGAGQKKKNSWVNKSKKSLVNQWNIVEDKALISRKKETINIRKR